MKSLSILFFAGCCMLLPLAVNASIEINGTRVIYPSTARSVTVHTTNRDASPYLVKAWVDQEDTENAENSDVPFLVTPPMSRVEPGDAQALRLALVKPVGVHDRESVYWLNVLAIPPNDPAKMEGRNVLQFAVRTRIKIFHRPKDLPGNPQDSPASLTWKFVEDDGQAFVECHNPTPFHVSMAEIALDGYKSLSGTMVPPMQSLRMKLDGPLKHGPAVGGVLSSINDYGGVVELPIRIDTLP